MMLPELQLLRRLKQAERHQQWLRKNMPNTVLARRINREVLQCRTELALLVNMQVAQWEAELRRARSVSHSSK